MKVLVTGGSGFIGTNLIEYLLEKYQGIEIVNFDLASPKDIAQERYWVKVDLMNEKLLEELIYKKNFEYVFHLAARTDINGKHMTDYLVNTVGTANLINALKKSSSVRKVLFASSMLVCRAGYIPSYDEDYTPTTAYGESKAVMEALIRTSDLDISWTIVRPTSIWGPWFEAPYRNFFELVRKGFFFHPGKKACKKTYGFIGNVVFQLDRLMSVENLITNKKVFYLGDDPPIDISDWADEISQISRGKINVTMPFWVFRVLAIFGDILKSANVRFPMTSFRLNNMTTDNVIDLKHLNDVIGSSPWRRHEATIITLNWLCHNETSQD